MPWEQPKKMAKRQKQRKKEKAREEEAETRAMRSQAGLSTITVARSTELREDRLPTV